MRQYSDKNQYFPNGPKMTQNDLCWIQRGPRMDPEWTQNGPRMDPKWIMKNATR